MRKEAKLMINSRKIKARMLELGLTQNDVANHLSIDKVTLNLKLNNKRRFYVDEVGKLCKALNITTSEELNDFFGIDFLTISTSCENDTKEMLGGA